MWELGLRLSNACDNACDDACDPMTEKFEI